MCLWMVGQKEHDSCTLCTSLNLSIRVNPLINPYVRRDLALPKHLTFIFPSEEMNLLEPGSNDTFESCLTWWLVMVTCWPQPHKNLSGRPTILLLTSDSKTMRRIGVCCFQLLTMGLICHVVIESVATLTKQNWNWRRRKKLGV